MTIEELQKQIDLLKKSLNDLNTRFNNFLSLSYRQQLRLKNALQGLKEYYVSDSKGGTVDRNLTFIDGILSSELETSVSPSISPSISPSKSPSVSPS